MLWMMDSAMMRQVTMVWWMVMYLGQASKDYFGWLRPPSPPLVRLEFSHLAEFSMPSTHAMAGTAIPLVLATLLLDRYDVSTSYLMDSYRCGGPYRCVCLCVCGGGGVDDDDDDDDDPLP
jgi:sphingosine-1-phosphate phosphatase 1